MLDLVAKFRDVFPTFNIDDFEVLTGGISCCTYKYVLDGAEVVVKLGDNLNNSREMFNEFFMESTISKISDFVECPCLFMTKDNHSLLIKPYIPGEIILSNNLTKGDIGEMVQLIRRIHSLSIDYDDIPKIVNISDMLNNMSIFFKEYNLDCSSFNLIISRCEDNLQKKPCLIHGDFWAGNAIRDNLNNVKLIDWSDSGIGCEYYEISFFIAEIFIVYGRNHADFAIKQFKFLNEYIFHDWLKIIIIKFHSHLVDWFEPYLKFNITTKVSIHKNFDELVSKVFLEGRLI